MRIRKWATIVAIAAIGFYFLKSTSSYVPFGPYQSFVNRI